MNDKRFLSVLFAVLMVGFGSFLFSQENKQLTVKETIGAAFLKPRVESEREARNLKAVFASANPNAKNQLYQLLNDHDFSGQHSTIISMIGYIGERDDVQRLNEWFYETLKEGLTKKEFQNVLSYIDALATMSRHEIMSAKNHLSKMVNREFWKKKFPEDYRFPDSMYSSYTKNHPVDVFVINSLRSYAISGEKDIRKKVKQYLSDIQDETLKNYAKSMLSNKAVKQLKSKNTNKYTRHNHPDVSVKWRSILMKQYREHWDEKESFPKQNSQNSESRRNRRSQRSTKKDLKKVSDNETKHVQKVIQEAFKAYNEIKEAVKDKNKEKLANLLLDDGEPLQKGNIQKSSEFSKAISQLARIVKMIDRFETKPVQLKIQKRKKYYADYHDEQEKLNNVKKNEMIELSYQLKGSGKALNEVKQITGGKTRTMKNNRLVVILKKINGKWYWNPFGW